MPAYGTYAESDICYLKLFETFFLYWVSCFKIYFVTPPGMENVGIHTENTINGSIKSHKDCDTHRPIANSLTNKILILYTFFTVSFIYHISYQSKL